MFFNFFFFFLPEKLTTLFGAAQTNKVEKNHLTAFQNQKTFLSRESVKHREHAAWNAHSEVAICCVWSVQELTQQHNTTQEKKTSQSQWIPTWTTNSQLVCMWVCLFWSFNAFWGFATQGQTELWNEEKQRLNLYARQCWMWLTQAAQCHSYNSNVSVDGYVSWLGVSSSPTSLIACFIIHGTIGQC